MMLRGVSLGLAVLAVAAASAAVAQNVDAIKSRQTLMKDFGKATKPLAGMLKGDAPFDLAAVKAALTTYADGAKKAPALFPDDSKTGGDTEASPDIWTKKADFEARFAKFGTDSEAALTGITDEASFKATMPKILGDCGGCHKAYRVKT